MLTREQIEANEQPTLAAGLRKHLPYDASSIDSTYRGISKNPRTAYIERLIRDLVSNTETRPHQLYMEKYSSLCILKNIEAEYTFTKFWDGLTLYFHCMAFMQYTSFQPLAKQDQDLKSRNDRGDLDIGYIVKDGSVTPMGRAYLESIEAKCKSIPGYKLDIKALVEYLKCETPATNLIIQLPKERSSVPPANARFRQEIMTDIGYIGNYTSPLSSEDQFFTVPSLAVMNYLNAMQSPKPVTWRPAFGGYSAVVDAETNVDTLPLALYSPWHHDNQVNRDGRRMGPVDSFLMDVAKGFRANQFTQEERAMLKNDVAPAVSSWAIDERIIEAGSSLSNEDKMKFDSVKRGMVRWAEDLGLFPFIHPLTKREDRVLAYVMTLVKVKAYASIDRILDGAYPESLTAEQINAPMGSLLADHLYVACARTAFQKRASNAPSAELWERIHEANQSVFNRGKRSHHVLNQLTALAHAYEADEQPQPSQLGLFAAVQGRSASVGRGESMNPRAQIS